MTNDQLTLDLGLDDINTITIKGDRSLYTVSAPNLTTGYTGDLTYTKDWIQSYDWATTPSITLGGTTLTEEKIKVLDDMKDMKEWMSQVDSKLAILRPNPKLEAEWTELKELREKYIQLEKTLEEKAKVWNILNQE
tara:strand:- start:951 stop:1358 length:408 start_codon:yes stop_codon:yes gene_type:complete